MEICPHCGQKIPARIMTQAEAGGVGGKSRSPKKQAASRENGRKGGRPRKLAAPQARLQPVATPRAPEKAPKQPPALTESKPRIDYGFDVFPGMPTCSSKIWDD
jgi:hypothetical protein